MRRRTAFGRNPNRLPSGDLPGWTNIFYDDMNYNFAVGDIDTDQTGALKLTSPARAQLGSRFTFYPDGWSTSHDGHVYPKTSGEPGFPGNWPAIVSKYQPTKTISFSNSVARFRLHSEPLAGVNTALGATMKPILAGGYKMGPYGRVGFRMRATNVIADDGTDYSAANNYTTSTNLRWNWVPLAIDSANWPANGELDAPEGSMNRAVAGNYHPASGVNETYHMDTISAANPNGLSPFDWHNFFWEWTPGRFRWIVDGTVYYDTTDRVPSLASAFLIQLEADFRQPTGEATAEIDWISMWSYTPGSVPSGGGGSGGSGPALATFDSAIYDSALFGA